MSSPWFLLQSGLGPPAENMACDEALLEWVARLGRPVLRFYGWSTPAATFGYFQQYAAVEAMTTLRPLIRRPTGGGLVPHDADWTYSVTVPPTDPWHRFKAVDSYRRIHEWVQAAFDQLGVKSELAPCQVVNASGQCFVGAEEFDLLLGDRKVAGAAQRRRQDGLLIQGSIQPAATGLERGVFEQAFLDVGTGRWNIGWEIFPNSNSFRERVRELNDEKYTKDDYQRDRLSGRKSSCDGPKGGS